MLGITEGVTEWLPVSSTGHLLLLERMLPMRDAVTREFYDFFLVAVQLGAVLAVALRFFGKINPFSVRKSKAERKETFSLWGRILLGCLPSAAVGLWLDEWIEAYLYTPLVIAAALVFYGVVFLIVERLLGKRRAESAELGWRRALGIGCFQVLALVPGTSRSGATILGARLLGCSAATAAEFSFLLALPVMLGATLLRGGAMLTAGYAMSATEWCILSIGGLTAFLVSLATLRFLTDFVRRHGFAVFGLYRVLIGIAVFIWLQ